MSGAVVWGDRGCSGMAGTYAGAALAGFATPTVQLVVFGAVMLLAAVFMLRPKKESAGGSGRDHPALLIAIEGITVGALTDAYTPYDWSDDYVPSFSSAGPTVEGDPACVKRRDALQPF